MQKLFKFEIGKWYKWTGSKKRPEWFRDCGRMDSILIGEPLKCTKVSSRSIKKGAESVFVAFNNEKVGFYYTSMETNSFTECGIDGTTFVEWYTPILDLLNCKHFQSQKNSTYYIRPTGELFFSKNKEITPNTGTWKSGNTSVCFNTGIKISRRRYWDKNTFTYDIENRTWKANLLGEASPKNRRCSLSTGWNDGHMENVLIQINRGLDPNMVEDKVDNKKGRPWYTPILAILNCGSYTKDTDSLYYINSSGWMFRTRAEDIVPIGAWWTSPGNPKITSTKTEFKIDPIKEWHYTYFKYDKKSCMWTAFLYREEECSSFKINITCPTSPYYGIMAKAANEGKDIDRELVEHRTKITYGKSFDACAEKLNQAHDSVIENKTKEDKYPFGHPYNSKAGIDYLRFMDSNHHESIENKELVKEVEQDSTTKNNIWLIWLVLNHARFTQQQFFMLYFMLSNKTKNEPTKIYSRNSI